jgi:hypothetical protein
LLWFSASLKFFIPFSLLIGLGSQLGQTPFAQKHATPAVSFAMARITQPFPDPMSFTPPRPVATNWPPITILGVWVSGFVAITTDTTTSLAPNPGRASIKMLRSIAGP